MKSILVSRAYSILLMLSVPFILGACSTSLDRLNLSDQGGPHLYNAGNDTLAKTAKENFDKFSITSAFDVENQNLEQLLSQEIDASNNIRSAQLRLQLWRFASSDQHTFWRELDAADQRLKAIGYKTYFDWRESRLRSRLKIDYIQNLEDRKNDVLFFGGDEIKASDLSCKKIEKLQALSPEDEKFRKTLSGFIGACQEIIELGFAAERDPFTDDPDALLQGAFMRWNAALDEVEGLKDELKTNQNNVKSVRGNIPSSDKNEDEKKADEPDNAQPLLAKCAKPQGCESAILDLLQKDKELSITRLLSFLDEESDAAVKADALGTVLSAVASGGIGSVCEDPSQVANEDGEPATGDDATENDDGADKTPCESLADAFEELTGADEEDFSALRSLSEALDTYRKARSAPPTAAMLVQLNQLQTEQAYIKSKLIFARRRADLERGRYTALRSEANALGDLQTFVCNYAFERARGEHPTGRADRNQDPCNLLIKNLTEQKLALGEREASIEANRRCSTGTDENDPILIGHCLWRDVLGASNKGMREQDELAKRWSFRAVSARGRAERARAEVDAYDFRIADLYHRETLAAGLFAIDSHRNLIAGGVDALAAYHASGIEPSEIGNAIFQAVAVAGIIHEVGE